MAKFSEIPAELIVNIMIKSAIYSGSFKTAYALAITSKKHYDCFKMQEQQIFIALMKYFLQPSLEPRFCTPVTTRFNIKATIGNLTITFITPFLEKDEKPKEDPLPVELVFKRQFDGAGGVPALQSPAYFAPLVAYLRGHDIAQYYTPTSRRSSRQTFVNTRYFYLECKAGKGPWLDGYVALEKLPNYEYPSQYSSVLSL